MEMTWGMGGDKGRGGDGKGVEMGKGDGVEMARRGVRLEMGRTGGNGKGREMGGGGGALSYCTV